MADRIVVYVTRDGHSRALALDLGKRLGAAVCEIGDKVNRKGLIGWIKSGYQASRGLATPISDPTPVLRDVHDLILVQPLWVGAVCPPLRTWLRAHIGEISTAKISLLASKGGSSGKPLKTKFEAEFLPLVAFATIKESQSQAEKDRELDSFVSRIAYLGT
jgi:hypothetical protein